ncbi:MAG: HAD family hydrolase [Tannerella sp.]|jgi:putative hydrolase of the HAD superfamily|nr:HAD family hydrolase [Tannerella sp.]
MKTSAKGLIFDYGGTIDTNGVHWGEVIRRAYERFGVPVTRDAFREAYVQVERTLGSRAVIRPDHTFREVLRIKLSLQFEILNIRDMSLAERIADACHADTVRTTLAASNVLDRLTQRYPAVLVSNFYGNLRTVLDEFRLSRYFKHVIESAEAGIRKPDPAIYLSGIEALGLRPEETVIIGDSYKNDIHPACTLGCPSIWLKGKGWDDRDETIEHPCIIKDFTELQDLLL